MSICRELYAGILLKKEMSALDINVCIDEIQNLVNSWVDKIYEINGIFLIRFRHPIEGRIELIIEPGRRIHLTSMKYHPPKKPTNFAMLLRKYLSNSKFIDIIQPDFERIVELVFSRKDTERTLIAELFGSGNLILCNENKQIIYPYKGKSWDARSIKSNEEYKYPPKTGLDIRSLNNKIIRAPLLESPDLVRGLARNLNIGGTIAEEICERAELDKNTKPKSLEEDDFKKIASITNELIEESKKPVIVFDDKKNPITVLPFPFRVFDDKKKIEFEKFNQALDNYFRYEMVNRVGDSHKKRLDKKIEKISNRLENQKNRLKELKEKAPNIKRKADAISSNYKIIDKVLNRLKELRRSSNWDDTKEIVDKARVSNEKWAKFIQLINPNDGTVTMELPEITVNVNLKFSAFENASKLYERHKRIGKKINGVKKAISKTLEKLENIKDEEPSEKSESVPEKPRKRNWFERYRWFKSSDDFLVLGGRDVHTNQEIVEKHMEPHDLYFHADIHGAPHVIVKTNGIEVPDVTIDESARFAATHSTAWREGLGNMDVYWANPDQVSKNAPSGEYLPKGSYMVRGERNYKTVPLEAGVGLVNINDDKIPMCGPPSSLETHSDNFVIIKPKGKKKSDLAKSIKGLLREKETEININDLIRILPPGEGTIVKR